MKKWLPLLLLFCCFSSGCDLHSLDDPDALVPATVVDNEALPSHTLESGLKLHLQTFGTNRGDNVVIVLHGGPGNDFRAYQSLEPLSDEYFLVLWDQRGSGLSERVPRAEITVDSYLQDLDELGRTFSPDAPFSLIGHSWGGAYATAYTQKHPDRIQKLILAEPMALYHEAAKNMKTVAVDITAGSTNQFLEASDHFVPDDDETADYLLAMTSIMDNKEDFYDESEAENLPFFRFGYQAYDKLSADLGFQDERYDYDFVDGLKTSFPTKVLLLAGSHSQRLGVEFQREYHEPVFNECETVEIMEAGHYLLYFNADAVLPLIRAYLNEQEEGR